MANAIDFNSAFFCSDFSDLDEHAVQVDQIDQEYEQLTAGPFQGQFAGLDFGNAVIFHEQTTQAVVERGIAASGMMAAGFPIGMNQQGVYCNELYGGEDFVFANSHAEFELFTPKQFNLLGILICPELFNTEADQIGFDQYPTKVYRAPRATHRYLLELCSQAITSAQCGQSLFGSQTIKKAFVSELVDVLGDMLDDNLSGTSARPTTVARLETLRKAMGFIHDSLPGPVSASDISTALNLPGRTLRLTFQKCLGMSVREYILAQRLAGARRQLLGDTQRRQHIYDVAADWGFWHFGRFSQYYRLMFGELPTTSRLRCREK